MYALKNGKEFDKNVREYVTSSLGCIEILQISENDGIFLLAKTIFKGYHSRQFKSSKPVQKECKLYYDAITNFTAPKMKKLLESKVFRALFMHYVNSESFKLFSVEDATMSANLGSFEQYISQLNWN